MQQANTKGGRPAGPVKKQVSFRLDPVVLEGLREWCEETGVPMTCLAERAVREGLDRWKMVRLQQR